MSPLIMCVLFGVALAVDPEPCDVISKGKLIGSNTKTVVATDEALNLLQLSPTGHLNGVQVKACDEPKPEILVDSSLHYLLVVGGQAEVTIYYDYVYTPPKTTTQPTPPKTTTTQAD